MSKKHKVEHKAKKLDSKKLITTNLSIMISAVFIIIATLIYRFEVAEQVFYLRPIILFLALMILFDTFSNEFKRQPSIVKAFQTIKIITGLIIVFMILALAYYMITIPVV